MKRLNQLNNCRSKSNDISNNTIKDRLNNTDNLEK